MTTPTLSGRDAYRAELTEIARHDSKVLCFEADLGGRKHPFADAHPDRFYNLGIAEATMIDMAAGLAEAGYKPFVSTFASFATLRAAESMKLSLGYLNAGVVVVAPYSGVSGAWFGTTHHCLEDLAVVQSFPGITIAAPYGENETRAVIRAAAEAGTPFYIRTGRNAAHTSLPFGGDTPPPVNWVRDGEGVCLVSVGETGTELCLAAGLEREEPAHAHLCYLDYANLKIAAEQLRERYDRFVVVEEHRPVGGVASTLALLLPGCEITGVNAGMNWPSEGGDHGEVLGQLDLDLAHLLHRLDLVRGS
jgi:transketolase